ncbi:protein FAM162A [Physeter macrocephalus]|uniref:Protein FAM162A n=1 Tax=Physeter macrocephalus TaxID=9755 RepID=A0A9W2WNT0_PHYMC|nr:protein FAM162A [Physeter catodon]
MGSLRGLRLAAVENGLENMSHAEYYLLPLKQIPFLLKQIDFIDLFNLDELIPLKSFVHILLTFSARLLQDIEYSALCYTVGSYFRFCERDAFSSLRLTRNSDLKRINGFCNKPQESPKPPTHTYGHRVPLHKPTDWEKKILIWSGRFKKEDEIPETVSFEMLDAAKNKVRVKISYVMIALTVAGCILMVIEGKKAAKRNETLTSLNLEKKARLREEAAVKAKTE